MSKIVIVNDGQERWAADKAELIAAMDKLGWAKGRALGQNARYEPDAPAPNEGQPSPYTDLCQEVQPVPMPEDADDCQTLCWYPAERAWLWS